VLAGDQPGTGDPWLRRAWFRLPEVEARHGRLDVLVNNAGINGGRVPALEATA
jgi:hypothetical protein